MDGSHAIGPCSPHYHPCCLLARKFLSSTLLFFTIYLRNLTGGGADQYFTIIGYILTLPLSLSLTSSSSTRTSSSSLSSSSSSSSSAKPSTRGHGSYLGQGPLRSLSRLILSSSLDRPSTYSSTEMKCCQHSGWCRRARRYCRGGSWLGAQSVEKLTYGWAKTMFVMEVIYYFCHFVRYCFPRPFRFPRALRGIV